MLGDKLREAREKQNLTYKDIEKGTSIRALYIEYIENGNYDELPGDVYTKGFIRSYANFLKLNPNELVQEFTAERHGGAAANAATAAPQAQAPRQEQPAPAPQAAAPKTSSEPAKPVKPAEQVRQPVPKAEPKPTVKAEPPKAAEPKAAPAPEPKATPAPQAPARQEKPVRQEVQQPAAKPAPQPQAQRPARPVKPAAPKERPARREKPAAKYDFDEPKRSNTKLIAIVAVILVVLAGAAYALSGSDDSASKAPQQTQQQEQAPAPKTYDDVEVTATFTADCWLEVKADDKTIYEGTLKKGDSQTWKGQDKVTVRVGDAGAVSFSVNGKDLGKAGKDGQVANKTFTKENN